MTLGFFKIGIVCGMLGALLCWAQAPQQPSTQAPAPSVLEQTTAARSTGSITGTVIDPTGALVPGARVQLAVSPSFNQELVSDDHAQFFFADVPAGDFQLTISAAGFAGQKFAGSLHAGEAQTVPPIVLNLPMARTTVEAQLPQAEVAEEQVKTEEKQRVLGIVPDFYISFVPNAAPLNTRQKFSLAWKTATDPFTFFMAGAIAGAQQAQDNFRGYGQEVQGYTKRLGASYADAVSSTFLADAILASAFKQDPRYFYKGTGSTGSRIRYALANAFICKGDNGHWQPNYSRILGHLAAAGISNLYYPASDRRGATLTFENAAIGIGGVMAANLFQEFVVRKVSPHMHKYDPQNP